jgi:hypothetical protein
MTRRPSHAVWRPRWPTRMGALAGSVDVVAAPLPLSRHSRKTTPLHGHSSAHLQFGSSSGSGRDSPPCHFPQEQQPHYAYALQPQPAFVYRPGAGGEHAEILLRAKPPAPAIRRRRAARVAIVVANYAPHANATQGVQSTNVTVLDFRTEMQQSVRQLPPITEHLIAPSNRTAAPTDT